MRDPKLEIIRFEEEDVIATSSTELPVDPGFDTQTIDGTGIEP